MNRVINATSADGQHKYMLTVDDTTGDGMIGDTGDGEKPGELPMAITEAFRVMKDGDYNKAKQMLQSAGYRISEDELQPGLVDNTPSFNPEPPATMPKIS